MPAVSELIAVVFICLQKGNMDWMRLLVMLVAFQAVISTLAQAQPSMTPLITLKMILKLS